MAIRPHRLDDAELVAVRVGEHDPRDISFDDRAQYSRAQACCPFRLRMRILGIQVDVAATGRRGRIYLLKSEVWSAALGVSCS
jgi:hypothetical protein